MKSNPETGLPQIWKTWKPGKMSTFDQNRENLEKLGKKFESQGIVTENF